MIMSVNWWLWGEEEKALLYGLFVRCVKRHNCRYYNYVRMLPCKSSRQGSRIDMNTTRELRKMLLLMYITFR